jgi:D-glycero-D-manno-heptose 1,7-bisphosphate phosphatase
MAVAVFVDKDGTLVENVPYNVDPMRVRLLPGAADGIRALHAAGYCVIVVSNQSGVARGFFAEMALIPVVGRLRDLLQACGVSLAGFYYCPHHPEGKVSRYATPCDCRKPAPGLLTRAARELSIDLRQSWMIGDILDDIEAGRRAGCRTLLIDNGGETEWLWSPPRTPHHWAPDLAQAAQIITSRHRKGESLTHGADLVFRAKLTMCET